LKFELVAAYLRLKLDNQQVTGGIAFLMCLMNIDLDGLNP